MTIENEAIKEINYKYGESVSTLILDGKIHRAGEKDHVWYVGHEWPYKGQSYQAINYGSWRHGDSFTVKSWDYSKESEKGFRTSFVKHTQDAKVKLDMEKGRNHEECRKKSAPLFEAATKGELHPYLEYKSITDPFVSRIDSNKTLLIPAYKPVKGLVGFQRIYQDPETGKFNKKFKFGIEISGAFCPLKPFKNEEYIYLSEGYATASSIQEAFPDIPSICVFNAGNISNAINSIRHINPKCKIIIAADKDPKSSAGEIHAKKACKSYPNTIYKLPSFSVDNPAWTDFNDLHAFESIKKVQDQLQFDDTEFSTVKCLGFSGENYFFTSSMNPQILVTTSKTISRNFLYSLAPEDYWQKNYGKENGDVLIIPWASIPSDLIKKCHDAGFFNPEKTRGLGVWKDGPNYVINNGTEVINKNEKSEFIYQRSAPYFYSVEEKNDQEFFNELISTIQSLKFKNKKDSIWLIAYIIQSQIFSVLDWRFQVWLTGPRGSGKSEILKIMAKLAPKGLLTENATAAGIIQDVQNNARAVFYDETEPEGERLRSIIELARQMSSEGDYKVLRGSPSGKGISFHTCTIFLLGSIQTLNLNTADKSRIFVIEMKDTKDQSKEEWENIKHNIDIFINEKHYIFSRAYNNIEFIKHNQKIISGRLRDRKMDSRLSDQISTALACFYILVDNIKIDNEIADKLIEYAELDQSSYFQENSSSDENDCYDAILQVVLNNQNETLAHVIEKISKLGEKETIGYQKDLSAHGIKYEKGAIFLSENEQLRRKLPKFSNYMRLLRRNAQVLVSNRKSAKINGRSATGIVIKAPTYEDL